MSKWTFRADELESDRSSHTGESLITFFIGKQQCFQVHKGLLCRHSLMCEMRLEGREYLKTPGIALPLSPPRAFKLWRDWIYQKVDYSQHCLEAFYEAHMLADDLISPAFQNKMMDEILKWHEKYQTWPAQPIVDVVVQATAPISPLRQFVADCHIFQQQARGSPPSITLTEAKSLGEAKLLGEAESLEDSQNFKQANTEDVAVVPDQDPRTTGTCRYHIHNPYIA